MSESDIQQQLTNIAQKLDTQGMKIDSIVIALHGDERYGAVGLMKRVGRLEKRVEKIEKLRDQAAWMILGAAAGSSGITALILKVLGI